MIATLSIDTLVAAAARVGVKIDLTDDANNLYVWHTPEREVVYIGKSASGRRTRDETKWRDWDPRDEIVSGIVTLLRANKAALQPLRYDPSEFDQSAWLILAETWSGPVVDTLRSYLTDHAPTPEDVEVLLIRICVRYGVPIGNSQFASQWETPIGSPMDTLAAISVFADDSFRP